MRRSNRLVLLIGVFLAILVFVLLVMQGGGGGGTPAASATPGPQTTVIAKVKIPLGASLTTEMLDVVTLDASKRLEGAFSDPSQLVDKIAQVEMGVGRQIVLADVTPQSPSLGLTHVDVPPGKRAIAVQVDQVSGVGTVIRKGDYVDAVLLIDFPTTQIDKATGSITVVAGIDSHSVKLLLQGMQVLGTLLPPVPQASGAPAGETGTTLNGQQEIVILAVDPQQAEVLRFGQTGTPPAPITLILRSPKDFMSEDGVTPTIPPDVITTGIVLKTLIDQYGVLTPQVVEAILPSPTPR